MNEIAEKIELSEIIEELSLPEEDVLNDRLLQLDAKLIRGEQIECPIEHQFTEHLYIREVFIPAGTLFTTYVHKTQNPYYTLGQLLVWDKDNKWSEISGAYRGITQKGTKRVVYAITDVIWTTYHYNKDDCRLVEILEKRLFEKYENPYLSLEEIKLIAK
jgi:hypothetical protein